MHIFNEIRIKYYNFDIQFQNEIKIPTNNLKTNIPNFAKRESKCSKADKSKN